MVAGGIRAMVAGGIRAMVAGGIRAMFCFKTAEVLFKMFIYCRWKRPYFMLVIVYNAL